MNFNYTCTFSNPVIGDGQTPPTDIKKDSWNFKNVSCTGTILNYPTSSTTTIELNLPFIEKINDQLFISKSFDYGQLIILSFIIPAIFLITIFTIRKLLLHKFLGQ